MEEELSLKDEAFARQIDTLADSLGRQEDEAVKGYGVLEDEFAAYLDEKLR